MNSVKSFFYSFNPRYMMPFFTALSVVLTSVFSIFIPAEPEGHIFTPPAEKEAITQGLEITDEYVIVVSDTASEAEITAANLLKSTFEEINGTKIDIITDTADKTEKEIALGKTDREYDDTVDYASLGDEGVCIKTVDDDLVITGGEKRGTLYSAYTFLEEYFGYRRFTPDLTVIPEAEKLLVPAEIDYTYVPPFMFRQTDWYPGNNKEYKVANRLNDGTMPEAAGGGVEYAGPFCHTFSSLVPTSLIETEPELFALGVQTGERTTDQLCLTNPKTLEIAKATVRDWLAANPDAAFVSVTQNDNSNYCVCEECARIDAEEGSHSGTMIRFVNAIADDIREDYPNVLVDTFAYTDGYTRQAPKITVPRDNVVIRLCSIECKFSAPMDSGYSEDNEEFLQDLKDWSAISDHLFVWDYTTDYNSLLSPFGNFGAIQRNLQIFAENDVIGVFEEGASGTAADGEFAALRCYMLSRLMWDPYQDVDKLMYDFCEAYYGAGYQNIIDFINGIDENNGFGFNIIQYWLIFPEHVDMEYGMGCFDKYYSMNVLNIDNETLKEYDELWENAIAQAQTEWQKENVRRSQICWRYWKANFKRGEFSALNESKRIAENEKFYNDLLHFNISSLMIANARHTGRLTDTPDFKTVPAEWVKAK
ncbi:MAG: DUF4838 domain-containing protein [Clostridia bacterium]|nr:DUF4838 domain-containing protein [Clostridia bacterium]